MANGNILSAGERDPHTLGSNDVETPTGTKDTEDLLGGRIEQRQEDTETLAATSRATLEDLSQHFQRIERFDYDPRLVRPPARTILGKLVHLRRAHDPQYDEKQRMRFEILKTRELVRVAQQMSSVAAQLRQSDPGADAFIKAKMKEAGEIAAIRQRIKAAPALARMAVQTLLADGKLDPGQAAAYERALTAKFAQVPGPDEVLKAEADLKGALSRIAEYEPDDDIPRLYPQYVDFMRNAKKAAKEDRAGKGKSDLSKFMTYQNLRTIYDDQLDAYQDILQAPAILLGASTTALGDPSPGLAKLPLQEDLVGLAKVKAVERFRDIVSGTAGKHKVDRAMQILFGPDSAADIVATIKARENMTPEEKEREIADMRSMVIENVRLQAESSVAE